MNGLPQLLCCTLLLALPLTATAEPSPGYSKRFPAKWLETSGEIRLDTICYNYPESSYMYRMCRQEAGNTLRSRCQRYRAVQQADPNDAHYQELTEKYCRAARLYRPFPQLEPNGQQ
ncbi:hypothetical protein GCM10009104_24900 [Marinobacterium maritimum]|uniref:Uncharacterized protein n=1 Tax=Marinobacterium maritimum TaxID=500162 RepID=A0ABN1I7Y0_9GAMM